MKQVKAVVMGLAILMLTGCESRKYMAPTEVQEDFTALLNKYSANVAELELTVRGDEVTVEVVSHKGEKVKDFGYLPAPNFWRGNYSVSYKCNGEDCSVVFDESAVEVLSGGLHDFLFQNYVESTLITLVRKDALKVS